MATETAAPAAPAPAPTPTPAPAAAPAPVTPPIPKAQADSAPKPVERKAPSAPPKPPATVDDGMRKLSEEMFKEAPDAPPATTPEPPKPEAKVEPKVEPKPAAPTPEKDPFEGMELPANASEAQKSNFKTLKAQAAEQVNRLKNERAALFKELETFKKATPADTADMTRIQAELKSAQDRLAVFDVSSHPDFQRQYVEPKKKALALADSLAKDYQVPNAAELKGLIDLPRPEFAKKLSEMAATMAPFDQNKFFNAMDEARNLQQQERGALDKAGELRASMQAKAAQEARTAFEASRAEFSSKIPAMETPEGASETQIAEIKAYNTARAEAIAEAESLTFSPLSERQVADVATRAAALKMVASHTVPMLTRQLKEARELIQAQNEQLKGIQAKKNPGSFAAGTETPAPAQAKNLRDLAKQMLGE